MDKQQLQGSGKIYFVPIEDFPLVEVEKLVSYYKEEYGIAIETLPQMRLDSSVVNDDREQLIAESVINLMKKNHAELLKNPQTLLLGLTLDDMYIAKYNWAFTFGYRDGERCAVVSNARMQSGLSFAPPEISRSRLRKMVTKNIGIMYYRLPQSDNPQSVLYKNVGGIQEIDYMGENF